MNGLTKTMKILISILVTIAIGFSTALIVHKQIDNSIKESYNEDYSVKSESK